MGEREIPRCNAIGFAILRPKRNLHLRLKITPIRNNMKRWLIFSVVYIICLASCHNTDCSNGIREVEEADIDCGGSCPECPLPSDTLSTAARRFLGVWKLEWMEQKMPNGPSIVTYYSDPVHCRIEFLENSSPSFPGPGFHGCVNGIDCSLDSSSFWAHRGGNILLDYVWYIANADDTALYFQDSYEVFNKTWKFRR